VFALGNPLHPSERVQCGGNCKMELIQPLLLPSSSASSELLRSFWDGGGGGGGGCGGGDTKRDLAYLHL
jgi:hypothetical protein